jgi:hypothetical protein
MEYDEEDYKRIEQYMGEERHIKYTNGDLSQNKSLPRNNSITSINARERTDSCFGQNTSTSD